MSDRAMPDLEQQGQFVQRQRQQHQLEMPNWLMQRAKLTPHRLALICEQEDGDKVTLDFQQLEQRVCQMAGQLAAAGITSNDHVAVLMQNKLDVVLIYHAINLLHAVLVPLNTRLTQAELAWQIEDVQARFVLVDDHLIEKVTQHKLTKIVNIVPLSLLHSRTAKQVPIPDEIQRSQTHSIVYTSGTTGKPKAVMLSNDNHWWSALGSVLNLGLHEQDHWLACLPFFHVGGLSILLRSIIYGIPVTIHETFDARQVNKAILHESISIVSVVTTMLIQMLDNLEETHTHYPTTFRCMLTGGGAIPLSILRRSQKRQVPLVQTYGMTETASQTATLSPTDMFSKLGSAGKPLFPAQLKIMVDAKQSAAKDAVSVADATSGEGAASTEAVMTEAATGNPGEIVVKGPHVMTGYHRLPEATNRCLRNGWFFTGDIGYVDEDGYLFVLDRRKDLIISGGENVYPAEIEAALLDHPMVLEAGVAGQQDDKWGHVPIVFVVLAENDQSNVDQLNQNPSHLAKVLRDFCEHQLASYKIPHSFYSVASLPRNTSQKLMRHQLLSLLKLSTCKQM